MDRHEKFNNNAWNNNTIVPNTTVTLGPNNIDASPTPVGCEQLPVTEGIFNAESTNTNAPHKANSNFFFGCSCTTFVMFFKPTTKNGINKTYQITAHLTGKNPSIICIAFETVGAKANIKVANRHHFKFAFFFFMSLPLKIIYLKMLYISLKYI